MKRPILSLLSLILFSFLAIAQADKPDLAVDDEKCVFIVPSIISPPNMCLGECVVIYTPLPGNHPIGELAEYTITMPGGESLFSTTDYLEFCPPGPGTYTVEAFLTNSGTMFQPSPRIIEVTEFFIPSISTNSIVECLANDTGEDGGNNCQQVCAGASVVYTADDSQGLDLEWEVSGAEDFQIEGNQAIVTWGNEGYGRITVSVAEPILPLQVQCQVILLSSGPTQESGEIMVYIEGGEGPYQLFFTLPNGETLERIGQEGVNTFTDVPGGLITIEVFSADQQLQTCTLSLNQPSPGSECQRFPTIYFTSSQIEDGNPATSCSFELSATIQGGVAPYTYQWSNGSTTSTIFTVQGFHSVTATDANGCTNSFSLLVDCLTSCMGSNEICVEILPEPLAQFSSSVPIVNGSIEICRGQTLFLFNESVNTNNYYWTFSPLDGSSAVHPQYTYEQAGTYELSLIASNDCFCSDTTSINVVVTNATVPPITCQGTICQGDIGTYSTTSGCPVYDWIVSGNGLILDGGGPLDTFVQVEWLGGEEGSISLSTPGCSSNACPQPNVIEIPIIGEGGIISGPTSVCPLEQVEFRVPAFSGTTLLWSISEGGVIVGNSNQTQLDAYWETSQASDSLWVAVTYDNCFLDCGGSDTFRLSLLPLFHVEGPTEICEFQSLTYEALSDNTAEGVNSHWTLEDQNGQNVWQSSSPSPSIDETLNLSPGNYNLTASPATAGEYCIPSASLPIRVRAAAEPPAGVLGPMTICPGSIYEYIADGEVGTHRFRWYVQNGSENSELEGTSVLVEWGPDEPYLLQLAQIPLSGPACESETTNFLLQAANSLSLSGDNTACVDATSIYSVSLPDNETASWQVTPSGSGSIISGAGTSQIEVYWNTSGPAQVVATSCGLSENIAVNVATGTVPTVQHPTAICPGSVATVSTTTGFSNYNWYNDQGQLMSTETSPLLAAGTYTLEVTNANGCSAITGFTIGEWPSPTARISTGAYPALCDGGNPVAIIALEEAESYQYQWFRDGQLLAESSSTLQANQVGVYWVIVTDLNSCSATSNTIQLRSCDELGGNCVNGLCLPNGTGPPNPPSGGSCNITGPITFAHSALQCDELLFTNLYNDFLPGSLNWNFGDPESGIQNSSTAENPIHQFTFPGVYTVIMTGLVSSTVAGQNCLVGVFENVEVPARADFDWQASCASEPVSFTDRSIFLPQESIVDWSWDFGDLASPDNTAIGSQVTHLFSAPGSYTVSLTIEMASGCSSTSTQLVSVTELIGGGIQLPVESCVQMALPFAVSTPTDDQQYNWDFINPQGNSIGTAQGTNVWQTFPLAGEYMVMLTTSTPGGCEVTETASFTINDNTLGGEIDVQPSDLVCSGDSIQLQAPPGGTTWLWQDNSNTESVTYYTNTIASLTLTDDFGCRYSPPALGLQFLPSPAAAIQSVEFNEYGQIVQAYDSYREICVGDGVFFLSQENENYSYLWSNGDTTHITGFYDERDTLLPVGLHNIQLTVMDTRTGCSFDTPPFQIEVHPTPDRPDIDDLDPACEGQLNTIYVNDPIDDLTYLWSDGQIGDTIFTIAGGDFYAYAQNEFGCLSVASYREQVFSQPNLDLMPRGCFMVCRPDTICVPPIPFVNFNGYQWYHEGVAVDNNAGNNRDLVVNEEGEYWLEVQVGSGNLACYFQSPSIFIEFAEGYGDIMGSVYFDTNDNGIIDFFTDSLSVNHPLYLYDENGDLVDIVNTDGSGQFLIDSVLSDQQYQLFLDTLGYGPSWYADSISVIQDLEGCGDISSANWLLRPDCSANFEVLNLAICPDEQVQIGDDFYTVGDSTLVRIELESYCDSFLLVDIDALRTDTDLLVVEACSNSGYTYEGIFIPPGQTANFHFTNAVGCDSVVTVDVIDNPIYELFDTLYSCPETPIFYEGMELYPGSLEPFDFQSVDGCDSTVWIQVDAYLTEQDTFHLSGCPGETISYGSHQLLAGDSLRLNYTNVQGCDSTIILYSSILEVQYDTLRPLVCLGDSYQHDGNTIGVGEAATFQYTNHVGCDSLVTILVEAYPSLPSLNWATEESCSGQNTGSLQLTSQPIPNLSYSLDQLNWQTEPQFNDLAAGSYQVYLLDENDCSTNQALQINAIPPLSIALEDAILDCNGDGVRLDPQTNTSDVLSWQWPDGSTADYWLADQAGTYSLLVSNACESLSTDFRVAWADDYPADYFYLPNVFSPNLDGLHDEWRPLPVAGLNIQSYHLQVFDRWGSLVFESNESQKGWNGRVQNGKIADPGVFVSMVEVELLYCGQVVSWQQSRDVLLLR